MNTAAYFRDNATKVTALITKTDIRHNRVFNSSYSQCLKVSLPSILPTTCRNSRVSLNIQMTSKYIEI